MSETDLEQRATVLAEMFLGIGTESTPERIEYYLRLLGNIPAPLLRESCDAAVLAAEEGFAPGPGAIARRARAIRGARLVAEREDRRRLEQHRERLAILKDREERIAAKSGGSV